MAEVCNKCTYLKQILMLQHKRAEKFILLIDCGFASLTDTIYSGTFTRVCQRAGLCDQSCVSIFIYVCVCAQKL